MTSRSFASDNYAGVHPRVLEAVVRAGEGHQQPYGDDEVTERLRQRVRQVFGPDATAYPMFTGTGANVVALQALTTPGQAVVCADSAHLHVDEGGAPERLAGVKLWTVPTPDGKLTPDLVARQAWGFEQVHRAQPACVSVAQATELGTVYDAAELAALAEQAHGLGMRFHVDGARLANAAAHLQVPLRALTTDVGVDMVSLGVTKNGGLGAEALLVLDPALDRRVGHLVKTSAQLASKMRFLSAQVDALLTDDLWLVTARHANAMAARLRDGLRGVVEPAYPVHANAVFARLPAAAVAPLQQRRRFYEWDRDHLVRWMCAWDTTPEDVDRFVADITSVLGDIAARPE